MNLSPTGSLFDHEEPAVGKVYILHDPSGAIMSVYGNANSAIDRAAYELTDNHQESLYIDAYDYVIYVTSDMGEITILIEDIKN